MPKITFVDHAGTARTIDGEVGSTVMETAIRNNVPGIDAECGGACACATCHVYVDEDWAEKVGPAEPMEQDMLDFASDVRATSRLSCQIPRHLRPRRPDPQDSRAARVAARVAAEVRRLCNGLPKDEPFGRSRAEP